MKIKIGFLFLIFTINFPKTYSNELGKKVYATCVACHGMSGEGRESQNAPKLSGQYTWYLERQIIAFKNKTRTGEYANTMYPFVSRLSESEIKAVSEYISELNSKK